MLCGLQGDIDGGALFVTLALFALFSWRVFARAEKFAAAGHRSSGGMAVDQGRGGS